MANGIVKQIIGTIFDADGLIEAEDKEDFEVRLMSLEEAWGMLEDDIGKERRFFAWFMKYKADDMACAMIRSVRKAAGIHNNERYYQNASESANNLLKLSTNFKKVTWPQFNSKLKE